MNYVGSLAAIALIMTAFGLMLEIVKPTGALKHIGAIISTVYLTDLRPISHSEGMVGYDTVGKDRSGCDWGCHLAVAATATTGTREIGKVLG